MGDHTTTATSANPLRDPAAILDEAVRLHAITASDAEAARAVQAGGDDPVAWLLNSGLITPLVLELIANSIGQLNELGPYRLLGVIGHGGMAVVYRARHQELHREVALKVLSVQQGDDPLFRERFLREVRAVAAIDHPHVVRCFDAGRVGGRLYLAMELVRGGDALQLVGNVGMLPEARALAIVRDAADGLSAFHAVGLVHRDIKPANILLDETGRAKLADLGLVRSAGESTRHTATGTAAGTPAYMSPEQACAASDLDIRADLWSLTATLYFLLLGKAPFEGPSGWAVVSQAMRSPIPDPRRVRPELSSGLSAVIARAGAVDRQLRHATPVELREDFEDLIAGNPPRHAGALTRCSFPSTGLTTSTRHRAVRPATHDDPTLPDPNVPELLIVDDDPLIVEVYGGRLTREGFRIVAAANGIEALHRIDERRPDLMVLDLAMPVVDGLAVLRRLRGDHRMRDLKVLVLTGDAGEETAAKARALGADRVLVKSPAAIAQIASVVREMLAITGPDEGTTRRQAQGELFRDLAGRLLGQARVTLDDLAARSDRGIACRELLPRLVRDLRPITCDGRGLGHGAAAILAAATEALAEDLRAWPEHAGVSALRTLGHSVEVLTTLTRRSEGVAEISGATALAVDDDRLSRRVVRESLAAMGLTVQCEGEPEAALAWLAGNRVHLVVSDVCMPGMDGFAFSARVRAMPGCRELPIILATGLSDIGARFAPSPDGANDLIFKPFLPVEVGVKALTHLYASAGIPTLAAGG